MSASDIYAEQKIGPGILSLPGRVLLCLMDDLDITRLALSLLLGVSESAIDKALSFLEGEKLIQIGRNGRKSRYIIDYETLNNHSDFRAIMTLRNNDYDQKRITDP